MTAAPMPAVFSRMLCPWLRPALARIEAARASHRLGHAWLLAGPAGVGKLNLALVLADRLLSAAPTSEPPPLAAADAAAALPDLRAPSDHHPDLHCVFPDEDKRSISVEQIRLITETLTLTAYRGTAKVVIIEPADAMTLPAANSLLKTLEEPTAGSFLLLVSHRPDWLPATVRSRCQTLAVPQPSAAELRAWLGVPKAADYLDLELLGGGSPLRLAELMASNDYLVKSRKLHDELLSISQDSVDPASVAARWAGADAERVLTWLARRLELVIRARFEPKGSTSVTDARNHALHNAWGGLTLMTLIEQHRRVEALRAQLGGGLNLELALRVLLIDFQTLQGQPS